MSKEPKPDVVFQAEESALPPPGDARNEELKRRHDALLQKAEELQKLLEVEGINPANWKVERDESIRPFDPDLNIPYPRSDSQYCWVYRDPRYQYGNRVVNAYQREGYEVVKQSDDDARGAGRLGAEGEIVNADCCLMRIKKDVKTALEAQQRARRTAIQEGIPVDLIDAAQKRGAKVHIGELPQGASHIVGASQSAMQSRQMKNQAARRMAGNRLDQLIRSGRIPGMEMR